jgi:hypothetical protein
MRGFKNCFLSDEFQVVKSNCIYTLHVDHIKEIGNAYKISYKQTDH